MDFREMLNSASVAAVVSLIVAIVNGYPIRRNNERAIQVENITKERAKWRNKLRSKAAEIHRAAGNDDLTKLAALRLDLALNLNPFDREDCAILDTIDRLATANNDEVLAELTDRLSLLLKHDWDRAKHEAHSYQIWRRRPIRASYIDLERRRAEPTTPWYMRRAT